MTTSLERGRSRSNFRIIDQLNAEWESLVGTTHGAVARWSGAWPPLHGCHDLDDALLAIRRAPDPTLGALLAEYADGDELAGRVVLQAMLGKTVRMAARDPGASVDDYLAGMWLRIRTYPRSRRPHRIAANLALDTLKSVTSERWSRRHISVTPVPSEALQQELETRAIQGASADYPSVSMDFSAQSVIAAARSIGLLDDCSRDVMLAVYAEGLSGRQAASRHNTSSDMIRYRCSRAVQRMAQHSAELAEAA